MSDDEEVQEVRKPKPKHAPAEFNVRVWRDGEICWRAEFTNGPYRGMMREGHTSGRALLHLAEDLVGDNLSAVVGAHALEDRIAGIEYAFHEARCTACGAQRVKNPDGSPGACSSIECPEPMRDYRAEKDRAQAPKVDPAIEYVRTGVMAEPIKPAPAKVGANARQVGGQHYKTAIEHWDWAAANDLDYFQGCITKYVARWKAKNGLEDLEKARHYLDKYIELEKSATENRQPESPEYGSGTGLAKVAAGAQNES